ncbi:MAG: DNA-processing protein DprA, partial [Acutalibacteraceae bacterium]|nr:DNA-processing protein DprA [Acutalibacteraceae bacterium]
MSKNNTLPFKKEFGYIRLARIIKPGSSKLSEILSTFGNIESINALKYEDWASSGILSKAELSRVENISSEEIYEVIKYCTINNIRIITPEDEEYPINFKYIENPPTVIYARGSKLDSGTPHIGVVGARKSTEFGQKAAYSLGAKLALSGFTVVSGGAVGIDSMA